MTRHPPSTVRRSWTGWGLLGLLAAAFALKAVVLLQLKDHPLLAPESGLDTTAYAQLAGQVLAGNVGLGPGLYYVSPFYIYFLAAIRGVFHSFTAVRVVQIAMGTASIGFIFLMTRRWFGERAAWYSATLATLTGLFTFYEVLILQSAVDVFLTAAALYALTLGLEASSGPTGKSTRRRDTFVLLAGIMWGIQALNRPNVLVAALAVAVVMLVILRRIAPPAVLVAGLCIGLAPVAVRNVVVAGEWTLVSSHGGLNFYIGNNANATGFYRPVPGVRPAIVGQENDTRRIASQALGHQATDAEASSYFFDLAWSWIGEHPLDAAALFLKKLFFTFHAVHIPLPQSYAFFAYDTPGVLRWLFVGPWLLSALGLTGLALKGSEGSRSSTESWSAGSRFLIWVSFVPAYAASVAMFFVADRYRLPLMVPLCVGAGGAIEIAVRTFREGSLRRLAVPAGACAVLLAAANYPVALNDGRWTEALRTVERLVIAGRYDEAEQWAAWLETHHPPRPGAGQLGTAQQLMALGLYDRALPYLERATREGSGDPQAEYALGQTLLKLGHAADALPHLRRGFDAGIDLPAGGEDYARALVDTGDLQGAAGALARIRPADAPDNGEAWLRLGRLAMEARAPDVAAPFFEHAAGMQPGDAATRQQYGLNLLVLNRFEDAARELSEAARLNPRDADTLSRLAYTELKLGHDQEARRHVQAALAVDPQDPLATQLAALWR